MMMQSEKIKENIEHNDLKALISDVVSIDQYKSKVAKDNKVVVIAFKIKDKDPAHDLSQFLETGQPSIDVDVSTGPDEDGMYTVYIEVERKPGMYDTVDSILKDVQNVDNMIKSWKFMAYENKREQDWSKENFEASVITSTAEYAKKHDPDAKAVSERLKFLNNY